MLCMAAMVGCSSDHETADCNRVASIRFPALLALAIRAARRST
jgi:hypothetical protein